MEVEYLPSRKKFIENAIHENKQQLAAEWKKPKEKNLRRSKQEESRSYNKIKAIHTILRTWKTKLNELNV